MNRHGNIRGKYTPFPASKGISAAEITRRHREREQAEEAVAVNRNDLDMLETIPDNPVSAEQPQELADSAVTAGTKRKRQTTKAEKRKKKKKDESDDEEDQGQSAGRSTFSHKNRSKDAGQIQFCAECSARFSVTKFSKKNPDGEGYLCNKCGNPAGNAPDNARVRRKATITRKKKVAQAKLEGEDLISKLQDLCIKLIAKYIDDVEALGEIGDVNMDKICQIISKKRSLNNDTLGLFLDVSNTKLNLEEIDPDHFMSIAQFCPNLDSISLKYCGKITDPVVNFYASHLKNLCSVTFNGPFLITVNAWKSAFATLGSRLEALVISDTTRFDIPTALKLVEYCPNIRKLGLSRLTQMNDEIVKVLAKLPGLVELDLSWPGDIVTDDSIIELLYQNGPSLTSINFDGCRELTERTLKTITSTCPLLAELSLQQCDRISDEGFTAAFTENVVLEGLINVNLERCLGIKDNAVQALIRHSAGHLRNLNLNSLDQLTRCTFDELASSVCPMLEVLDVGFVRAIDDEICGKVIKACPTLSILKVFGCSRITETIDSDLRMGVRLIGRESDFL
ncbi:DNA repair protein rhp7 [Neolecta irregularis DAH-3]|uniref:DNA repair protein rhp7 n=1 Tax=Neolecta irregularis (strain DAH-3) TaxID=1198029 RepID=A0A1U7LSS3_NEOID|nr:DNA repair protein rhp7 [Neolecta irregularis DAH-3]|eukprot:OLL25633.1 DNA repair protein rhp7 [Neolecta irregularis DAH-3]